MVLSIEGSNYKVEDILYINTAYMIMGLYVITIYFKSQKDPLILEYNNKDEYDNIVKYLKKILTIH
jgi:hypothetical protein